MKRIMLAAILASACGGGSSSAEGADPGETSGDEASGLEQTCVAFFTRQRECRAEFVPALVDLRVRLDRPLGIAARVETEGRDAIVAEANTEYDGDSTDEAIAAQCQGIAAEAAAEAESAQAGFATCVEQADCASFVPCDLALLEEHWNQGGE
jgi:hypothetical protein